jgi:hypothetical protein
VEFLDGSTTSPKMVGTGVGADRTTPFDVYVCGGRNGAGHAGEGVARGSELCVGSF